MQPRPRTQPKEHQITNPQRSHEAASAQPFRFQSLPADICIQPYLHALSNIQVFIFEHYQIRRSDLSLFLVA